MSEWLFSDKLTDRFAAALPALEDEDGSVRAKAAKKILAKDAGNPFAKYAEWQCDDASGKEDLEAIVSSVRGDIESAYDEMFGETEIECERDGAAFASGDIFQTYAMMLSDLASARYFTDDHEGAFEAAAACVQYDVANMLDFGRSIYMYMLIKKERYDEAVDAADDDASDSTFSAHCRAIALYEKEGAGDDAADALLEALSHDPDLACAVVGIFEFDDEAAGEGLSDDERAEMEDLIIDSSMLEELWSINDERLSFISSFTFAMAYATGRIVDDEDIASLEESYAKLECLEDMREIRDTTQARVAAGEDAETTDDEALMAIRELSSSKGIFR